MDFDRILIGIIKYIRTYMYATFNTWQKLIMETAIARLTQSSEVVKKELLENVFAKTLKIADGNLIDVDGLFADMKKAFNYVPTVDFNLPLLGKFKFGVGDLEVVHKCIKEA